mmetsp:Transcript_14662/g.30905  ORF Transcript_14662/g.30905 Transcript_14662/m.30905 type:complete len:247 (-) Transcript_14662:413-1153(-)
MEFTFLFQIGVVGSASTSTSKSSASSAKALIKPAIVLAPNRDCGLLFLKMPLLLFTSVELSPLTIAASLLVFSPGFSPTPSSASLLDDDLVSAFGSSPLPKEENHLSGPEPFLSIVSSALLPPEITPCSKSFKRRSRYNFDCSSSPSRSCDLNLIPSSIDRALRLVHSGSRFDDLLPFLLRFSLLGNSYPIIELLDSTSFPCSRKFEALDNSTYRSPSDLSCSFRANRPFFLMSIVVILFFVANWL